MNKFMTMTSVVALLTGISGQRQTKIMEKTMRRIAYVLASVALAGFVAAPVLAKAGLETEAVDCSAGDSIQEAVNSADGPTTIFISGNCDEDVSITQDDITLSGNQAGVACIPATPGGTGEIDGTVTVDGVRATIEFLTITGSGIGVDIVNRADVHLVCNDISLNEESGVGVRQSSSAVLRDNTVSGNGTRATSPFIFFDCGLFAVDASSVNSDGNTYADNQYCAVEIDRQSSFRNGFFLPREPDHPADPDGRDIITEKGCNPSTGTGCLTNEGGPVALVAFNGGLIDIRNADINGEIEATALSSFRVDGDAAVQGNILAVIGSIVRLRDRSFLGDRKVTYKGTLTCDATSQSWFSSVQCGQTCSGAIPGTCVP